MLVLCRRVIAGLLKESIEKKKRMKTVSVYDYKRAGSEAMLHCPDIALVEIPEKYGFPAAETLAVCEEIKKASAGCRIVLLCPEQDSESVYICTEEKKRGGIADFLFYDSTVEYLIAKLDALLPA